MYRVFLFLGIIIFYGKNTLNAQSLFLTKGNYTLGAVLGYAKVENTNNYILTMPISSSHISLIPAMTYSNDDIKFGGGVELFLLKNKSTKQPFSLSASYSYIDKVSSKGASVFANVLDNNKTRIYANFGFIRATGEFIDGTSALAYGAILSTRLKTGYLFTAFQWTSTLKSDAGVFNISIGINGFIKGSKELEKIE